VYSNRIFHSKLTANVTCEIYGFQNAYSYGFVGVVEKLWECLDWKNKKLYTFDTLSFALLEIPSNCKRKSILFQVNHFPTLINIQ